MSEAKPQAFFVSYSHDDTDWRERLFDSGLDTTTGVCAVWFDQQLEPGDRWREKIDEQLAGCTVAVLLVSEKFLDSPFICNNELPLILQRAREGALRIVWIPIAIDRDTLQARQPELAEIQGGRGFSQALAARPHQVTSEVLDGVRQHILQQMRAAVDPLGAELSQRVADRYAVEKRLGEGNLAAVYLASDKVLKRSVAIKVLKDVRQREAFLDDVREGLRTSEEPNFVNIYDATSTGSTAYCVVQHVPGGTLRDLLREPKNEGGLPVETVRRVFLRLATAIARAHAQDPRYAYGNLKPSNVFLDEGLEPFILPIGRRRDAAREHQAVTELVARRQAADASGQPVSESDLEDLAYLVPEHFGEQIEELNPQRADQYMLGLLAYEMATGKRPKTLTDPGMLLRDGMDAFVPLEQVTRLQCPQRLRAMVARMAAIDPAQRFKSLSEALQEPDLHDELNLVVARDSYRRCTQAAGFDEKFFQRVYDEMQGGRDDVQRFFAAFGPDDWARQHRMLKQAVLLLFAFAQQRDGNEEPNLLSPIADSHASIPAGLYAPFVDALVHTVCGDEVRGTTAFDPASTNSVTARQLARHWRSALSPGIDYLVRRAQRTR